MKETRDICSGGIACRMCKGIYGRDDNKTKGVTGKGGRKETSAIKNHGMLWCGETQNGSQLHR